jgi:hypothetical protein
MNDNHAHHLVGVYLTRGLDRFCMKKQCGEPEIVLYCSFFLIKKNQKIKAVFKSCAFASLYGGFAPQTRPSCVGAQTGVLSTASKGAKSGFE